MTRISGADRAARVMPGNGEEIFIHTERVSTRELLAKVTEDYGKDLDMARLAGAVASLVETHRPYRHPSGVVRCSDDKKRYPCPTILPILFACLPSKMVRAGTMGRIEWDNSEWFPESTLLDEAAYRRLAQRTERIVGRG